MLSYISSLLTHYGYIVLFLVLTVELIALPTPGETLMTYCGFLVSQGKLNWVLSILIASLGVMTGVTISYIIGRTVGLAFFKRFGKYVHLGPERLDKMSAWFARYGDKLLFITYFVPGIRHVTGHFSGIMKVSYKKFALKAYIGAFLWTSTFISLGKVLGSHYRIIHKSLRKYLIIAIIIIAIALVIFYFYRNHKEDIVDFVFRFLNYLNRVFHSLGKIKIVIFGAAFIFVSLTVLFFWLADNFLDNDLTRFDKVINLLVRLIFTGDWTGFMNTVRLLLSVWGLSASCILALLWIIKKRVNLRLEIPSFLITIFGGIVISYGLTVLFNNLAPLSPSVPVQIRHKFPSQQTLMVVALYGYAAFIVIRHTKQSFIRVSASVSALLICLLTGLSLIFLHIQNPSDVLAGYAFGGIWLSINVVLLEIFRILPMLQSMGNNGTGE